MKTFLYRLIAFSSLTILTFGQAVHAEGLLGKQYLGFGYTYTSFGDDEFDDVFGHGDTYTGVVNLPIISHFDLQPVASYFTTEGGGFDASQLKLGARAILRLEDKAEVNPFLTGGVFYTDSEVELFGFEADDEDTLWELGGGVEIDLGSAILQPAFVWEKSGGSDEYVLSALLGGWLGESIFLGIQPAYRTESENALITGVFVFEL